MTTDRPVQLVWLKRDLRLRDHAPLAEAARRGPVLVLYVYEPELLRAPTHDRRHLDFVEECLAEVESGLNARGGRLVRRIGTLPEIFAELHREVGFEALWSHEETGNDLSYARDRRVARWCREVGIPWHEIPQHGVVRPLVNRDGWAARWRARMSGPVVPVPARLDGASVSVGPGLLDAARFGLGASTCTDRQRGGESRGLELLDSFLAGRSISYQTAMSSPVTAWEECSRLSPYLAYGALSLREVFQRTVARRAELKQEKADGHELPPTWLRSLASFEKRLRWHCHFMQKLEDQPSLEFENMARVYDGLREDDWNEERFERWASGQTGYPMIDACMRCLHETGWINFRMRAMLVSFASYHLWLHWPRTAEHLARLFVDYEPGIHYPQVQMQSGVTGINTVRIYSPIKQVKDQDPTGVFLRRWVPELAGVPDADLPEPHRMKRSLQQHVGCVIGRDYPAPLVDHAEAVRAARSRIHSIRSRREAREESLEIVRRHGSRRRPPKHRRSA